MPRKIRELKAEITKKGFVYLPKRGKGSLDTLRAKAAEFPTYREVL